MCAACCLPQWALLPYFLCSEGSRCRVLPFPWPLLGEVWDSNCFWRKNKLKIVLYWARFWIHKHLLSDTIWPSVTNAHCTAVSLARTAHFKQVWFAVSERGRPEGALKIIQCRELLGPHSLADQKRVRSLCSNNTQFPFYTYCGSE